MEEVEIIKQIQDSTATVLIMRLAVIKSPTEAIDSTHGSMFSLQKKLHLQSDALVFFTEGFRKET